MEVDVVLLLLLIGVIVFFVATMWIVFEKAGQPGWAAIIPFFNLYVMVCKVAQKDVLWFILCFVPIVNFVIVILVYIEVANKFGHGALFGLGLAFLGFIFFPILAFGGARYEGRESRTGGGRPAFVEDEKW